MKNNFKWKTNTLHAKKNLSTLMVIFSEKKLNLIKFDQTHFFVFLFLSGIFLF